MPGFVAAVMVDREAGVGGVWMANTTYGGDRELVGDLLAIVHRAEPPVVDEWLAAELAPGVALEQLGTWYWGPNAFALSSRGDGLLELDAIGRPGRASRFRPDGDAWVGLDGYFLGERLRFHGGHFELATFVFTRRPYADGPIPGGVDPGGWTAAE